jgi:hypothetical protein
MRPENHQYKIGDIVMLNIATITPIYAEVVEAGNTYVKVKSNNHVERIASTDYHKRIRPVPKQ